MRATLQKTENGYGLKEMVAFVSSVRPEHKHHKLSLSNCQAIELGFDLDKLVETIFPSLENSRTSLRMWVSEMERGSQRSAFIKGFKKAVEILGDKKFTEEDVKKALYEKAINFEIYCNEFGVNGKYTKSDEEIIQSLQQTEWSVEVEMENDINQCDGCKAGHELDGHLHIDPKTGSRYMSCQKDKYQRPKLDADGCLILKRV